MVRVEVLLVAAIQAQHTRLTEVSVVFEDDTAATADQAYRTTPASTGFSRNPLVAGFQAQQRTAYRRSPAGQGQRAPDAAPVMPGIQAVFEEETTAISEEESDDTDANEIYSRHPLVAGFQAQQPSAFRCLAADQGRSTVHGDSNTAQRAALLDLSIQASRQADEKMAHGFQHACADILHRCDPGRGKAGNHGGPQAGMRGGTDEDD